MKMETLEREHGQGVVAHLSQALHMPGMTLEEMCAAEAAFDLVPYAECARRCCVALRNEDGAVAVVLAILWLAKASRKFTGPAAQPDRPAAR